MSEAARIRLLTIGILVAVLAVAGALLSIPLLIKDPLPVVRPDSRITFSTEAEPGRITARLHINVAGDFVLLVGMAYGDEQASPPRIIFEMLDHDMPAVEPEVQVSGAGDFRATGRLEMPGRWQLRILKNADPQIFEFILAEF